MSNRSLSVLLVVVMGVSTWEGEFAYADVESYQVETSASGQIPITPFDSTRGTLRRVVLDVILRSARTSEFGPHWHQINGALSSGSTTPSGGHAHLVEIPRYFSNGLTLPSFSFVTSGVASHVHGVSVFPGTRPTATAEPHGHWIPQVSRQYIFTGTSLAPFVGSAFGIRTPIVSTRPSGAHHHSFQGRPTSTDGAHQHRSLLSWTVITTFEFAPAAPSVFRRGEVRQDGQTNVSDGIAIFAFLFLAGLPPQCPDAADANDNGEVNLSDGIFLLEGLFLGAAPPPAPDSRECGPDPTTDSLPDCEFGDESCG